LTAHAQRISYHNLAHSVFFKQLANFAQVEAAVASLQGRESLGDQAQRIGDSDSNASRTYVQAENSPLTIGRRSLTGIHAAIIGAAARLIWGEVEVNAERRKGGDFVNFPPGNELQIQPLEEEN
jgi:hypothetical protein